MEELPDLIKKDALRKKARGEHTFSGELRRAIQASELSLSAIARKVHLTLLSLDDFLTGEGTLPSDVIDRLVEVLGYELSRSH